MNKEECQEYCKKIMEEEYKQTILDLMIEKETLRLTNSRLIEKLSQKENKLNAIKEQIKKEYETVKYDCVPARKIALDHISEILEEENK